jgi:hypothetical protein
MKTISIRVVSEASAKVKLKVQEVYWGKCFGGWRKGQQGGGSSQRSDPSEWQEGGSLERRVSDLALRKA